MEGFLSWGIQSAIMLGIGSIGYFLKSTNSKLDERITQNEKKIDLLEENVFQKIDELKKDLSDHKELLQRDFINKKDHAQTYGEMNKKLDKIQDYLMQLVKERR